MTLKSKSRRIATKLRSKVYFPFVHGDLEAVQKILKGNAFVDPSIWLDTLISESLNSGHSGNVELFKGLDVNAAQPIDHTSALFFASFKGDKKICADLINRGANWLLSTEGYQLLFRLLENDDGSIVAAISSQKNWYGKKSRSGLTFAHVASSLGQVGPLGLAIDAGADINAISKDSQRTSLHYAFEGGSSDCVSYLVGAGANVHAEDKLGRTPMHCGLASCNVDAVVTYMRLKGLSPFDSVTESVCEFYKGRALEVLFSRSASALRALEQHRQAHMSMNAANAIEAVFLGAAEPAYVAAEQPVRKRLSSMQL